MVSRMPPSSPARIMAVYSSGKASGCFFRASEIERPPSMSVGPSQDLLKGGVLASGPPRMRRPCTMGTPALTRVESWREKSTRSLEVTSPLPGRGRFFKEIGQGSVPLSAISR